MNEKVREYNFQDMAVKEQIVHSDPEAVVGVESHLVTKTKARRPFGLAAGEFVVPDDFDDPLPDELLDAFEGR